MRIFNKIFIFLTENYNISIQSLTMINPSRKIYNIYYSSRRHPFHPLRFKNTSISMNIEKYIYSWTSNFNFYSIRGERVRRGMGTINVYTE